MSSSKALGMTEKEYQDLQIWIRHGRVGIGHSYQHEVERGYKLENCPCGGWDCSASPGGPLYNCPYTLVSGSGDGK